MKPRVLVISHVLPYPGTAGQQQRVRYSLQALRQFFQVVFLTAVPAAAVEQVREQLAAHCDETIVMTAVYPGSRISQASKRLKGLIYQLHSGLKFSNYVLGQLEYSAERLKQATHGEGFDLVLYEYWHTVASVQVFQERGTPCVLDMHNVLWHSYEQQLLSRSWLPSVIRDWAVRRYQRREERAWGMYDGLIAINRAEYEYVRQNTSRREQLYYTPMGIDLELWPYIWQPARPLRLAYYGGLGSRANQTSAIQCAQEIMPLVWQVYPDAQLWIIGSHPPDEIRQLAQQDARLHVTGFVEDVQAVLSSMSVLLCPWHGTYGFRSRLIEVMAIGLPVICMPEAVYGMDLNEQDGILFGEDSPAMARQALSLLNNPGLLAQHSLLGRKRVEELYSYECTYLSLARQLSTWITANPDWSSTN